MHQTLPPLDALVGRFRGRQAAARRLTAATAVLALLVGAQSLLGAVGPAAPDGGLRIAEAPTLLASGMPDAGMALGRPMAASGVVGEGAGVSTAVDEEGEVAPHEGPATTHQPRIILHAQGPATGDAVRQAMDVEGVTFATAIELGEVEVAAADGPASVEIAAVEVNGFREMTPQISAGHAELWERIREGDAAFTHDVASRLHLELGSHVAVSFPGAAEDADLRVGAHASNGVPPVADAVLSRESARALGFVGERALLVALAQGADVDRVAAALAAATGMRAEVIPGVTTRKAFITGAAARDAFEPFSYVSLGDGMIQIDRDWVARNIVTEQVPVFRGPVTCHRLLMPQLRGALQEVVDRDLDHLIDPSQYAGCWVPRHILFNPRRGISMHAWGLAVDFNVKGNEYGNRNPEMDPRIVDVFERWGFTWGGRWSTPDGMHFELGALLDGSAT